MVMSCVIVVGVICVVCGEGAGGGGGSVGGRGGGRGGSTGASRAFTSYIMQSIVSPRRNVLD